MTPNQVGAARKVSRSVEIRFGTWRYQLVGEGKENSSLVASVTMVDGHHGTGHDSESSCGSWAETCMASAWARIACLTLSTLLRRGDNVMPVERYAGLPYPLISGDQCVFVYQQSLRRMSSDGLLWIQPCRRTATCTACVWRTSPGAVTHSPVKGTYSCRART